MKTGITLDGLMSKVYSENQMKADYMADTRRLTMESAGQSLSLRMLDDRNHDIAEPFDINQNAHRQIGTHLKIPATYYDRMLSENPGLLAGNVNSWFQRDPSTRMLRTLNGTARAFLSNRYRRIDHMEIMGAVLPIIGEMPDIRFESCEITDSKIYIKAVNPRLQTDVAVGDTVQAGIIITNSETGQGAVSIQPLIFRLVCLNGMVVNDAGARRNHIGRVNNSDENYLLYSDDTLKADDGAFLMKVRDTVRAAADEARFSQVISTMKDAKGIKMNTGNIPAVVKLAGKNYGLTDTESDSVLNRLIDGRDLSLYGLANAVTRHSQDIESYDRATDLESIGYNILTMEPRIWNRVNQVALDYAA
jgi:hypothetical protein